MRRQRSEHQLEKPDCDVSVAISNLIGLPSMEAKKHDKKVTVVDFEETKITYTNAKDHLTGKVAACNLDKPNSVYVCFLSSTS